MSRDLMIPTAIAGAAWATLALMAVLGKIVDWTGLIVWSVATLIYFVPTIIAFSADHRQRVAICALNLVAGWTLIGWVVALVWSLMRERPQPAH